MSRASSSRAAAFTMLEVLAAVALLGILYTTLAGVAAAWLRSEGESRRRFEASLAADRRLAELEAQVAAGAVPAPGESVAEEDPFRVTTRVEDFELPIELFEPAEPVAKPQQEGARPAAGSTLFPRQGEQVRSPLRLIQIFVAWDEGDEQRRVERTTLAFDRSAAQAALAALPRPQEAP
jgi:prepilin-type N-terminal cleavage/methylation domain-containing protein